MKPFLLFCLFFIGGQLYTYCQDTTIINSRYTLDASALVFTGLEITDSCYYITAVSYDTIPNSANALNIGSFFIKTDTNGSIIYSKQIIGELQTFELWGKNGGKILSTQDGNLLSFGVSVDWSSDTLPTVMFAMLFKFIPNGDTIWTRRYSFDRDDFFRIDDAAISDNGDILLVSTFATVNSFDSSNILVMRVDSLGMIEDYRIIGHPDKPEVSPSLEKDIDHNFILSYAGELPYYRKIDSSGAQIWAFTPLPIGGGIGAAKDIVVTQDSSYVFATTKYLGYINGQHQVIGDVFKYKQNQGMVWNRELRTDASTLDVKMNKLAILSNGNIIAAGTGIQLATNSITIWVNLLSTDGDSLWSKHYYPVGAGTATNLFHEHIVYDMELTPSGYLVLCGETRDPEYYPQPTQQGFLLKIGIPTDTTQLQSAQQAIGSEGFYMRLYPNPAQDYTIIDFSTTLGEQENYRIFISNAQGQVLRDIPVQSANSGYIVDVAGLAAGVYYVSVLRGGQVLRTEKLVKQ